MAGDSRETTAASQPEPFRVCRECWVRHVENCPECFGFGFTEEGAIMRAGDAFDGSWEDGGFRVCGVCGGSPMGCIIYG